MSKVYVSSTVADLKQERQAVIDWLVQANHQPVHSYRPDSETVRDSCLEDIDGCDLYVLILGHRFGFVPEQENPEGLSITQLEFRRAASKPRIALLRTSIPDVALSDIGDPTRFQCVQSFRNEVQRETRAAQFSDVGTLIAALSTGVQGALAKQEGRVLPNDPAVLEIIKSLTREIDAKAKENADLRARVGELEKAAIARMLTAAAQPGASAAAIEAAAALQRGDTRPAETALRQEERSAATTAALPETVGEDERAARREAAQLAREQAALASGRDAQAALLAYQRAADYDPDDTWTHFFIGDLQRVLGDQAAARDSYESGRSAAERRVSANERDTDARRDLSVSHNRIGDVLLTEGDGGGALAAFRAGLAIAQWLARQDPDNTDWQRDLSVSHSKIGDVLLAQGDGDGALAAFGETLAIAERLAEQDPQNTDWQRDLAIGHDRIGDVLLAKGDHNSALAAFRKSLEIAQRLTRQDPENADLQRDLTVSQNKIGDVLLAQGDSDGALAAVRMSLAIAEGLTKKDQNNTAWQHDLSVSHNKIGDALQAKHDFDGALAAYRRSLAIFEQLGAHDPNNTIWQRDLAAIRFKIGEVLLATGDGAAALASFRTSFSALEGLAGRDPTNAKWQVDIAECCSKLASIESLDRQERRFFLQRGRDILQRLRDEHRLIPGEAWVARLDGGLPVLEGEVPDAEALTRRKSQ